MPRELAQQVLETIEGEDAYSHIALDVALSRSALDARDRGLVTELVYGTLTWQRALDTILGEFLSGGVGSLDQTVRIALRLAAYQIVFLDKIPPHAAVNEAVEIVKNSPSRRASGLVNGVLRNLLRKDEPLTWWREEDVQKKPSRYLGQRYSMPNWLANRMLQTWGFERAEAIADAFTQRAPLYLRAPSGSELAELPDGLKAAQYGENAAVPGAFLAETLSDSVREGLGQGQWVVQDLGSQLIGLFSGAAPGMKVLDACAGLGGKTLHLAEMVGPEGRVVAVDPVESKLELLRAGAEQAGLSERVEVQGGALQKFGESGGASAFDMVLVDAPCTGLGVIRRHPETRWRRERTDIAVLAEIQAELLDAAAALVPAGGTLVYSVCTFSREEGPAQVEKFLARHPEFEPAPLPTAGPGAAVDWTPYLFNSGDDDAPFQLLLNPYEHGTDGFFAARLRRR